MTLIKLKLADSLTPKQVRTIMKKYNNRTIDVDNFELHPLYPVFVLDDDYIAVATGLFDNGLQVYFVEHKSILPPF